LKGKWRDHSRHGKHPAGRESTRMKKETEAYRGTLEEGGERLSGKSRGEERVFFSYPGVAHSPFRERGLEWN